MSIVLKDMHEVQNNWLKSKLRPLLFRMHLSKICITFHLELKMEFVQKMWKVLNVWGWPRSSWGSWILILQLKPGLFWSWEFSSEQEGGTQTWLLWVPCAAFCTALCVLFPHTKYRNWTEILESILVINIMQSHFWLMVFVAFKSNEVLLLDSKQNIFQYGVWGFVSFFKIAKC